MKLVFSGLQHSASFNTSTLKTHTLYSLEIRHFTAKMDEEEDEFECNCEDCQSQKPSEPLPSDCCGSGCEPCVNDLYETDIKTWKKSCFRRHHGTESNDRDPNSRVIETNSFKSFQLDSITAESSDTWCYRFVVPDRGSLNLDVGQHLVLRAQVNDRWITRQYTPVSPLKAKGYFDMLIKLYADGLMSRCIREWKVGDLVEWRGPYGSYQYQQNKYSHIVMLAAGTGIAPMLQIIRHNEEEDTFVRLLYCCRTYKDLLLRAELTHLAAYWNFTVLYILSQEEKSTCPAQFGEQTHFGRLDEALLAKELPPNHGAKAQVLICGTKSFDKDMMKYLRRMEFQGNVFKF